MMYLCSVEEQQADLAVTRSYIIYVYMKTNYEFRITAHINDDAMFLLREEYDRNIIFDDGDVLRMVKRNMPFAKWELDDGDDEAYTDYCQYVCYPEEDNTDNYILASWDCYY